MSKDSPTFDEKFSVALIELGIRSLLLGGVACNIYGSTRYSEDLDWWIDPAPGIESWVHSVLAACKQTQDHCEFIRLSDHSLICKYGPESDTPLIKEDILKV